MIVVGTVIDSTKTKIEGCFVEGSVTATILEVSPPNPIENKFGKTSVLFLNTVTNELFWDYEDRELTELEKIEERTLLAESAINDLIEISMPPM